MKNQYLIVSTDQTTINYQIEQILGKKKDIERISYDLTETPIERVVEDLDTYNFLSNEKGIVAYNASFLSPEKKKSEIEHNLKVFEKYLLNPSPDNILILVVDNLDKRKKITSLLLENATVLEKELNIKDLIKKELEDYKVDSRTVDFLISYCGNNNGKILNELEKLKLYKYDTKEITISDIKEIVRQSLEDNIFTFVDSVLKGNKKESFRMYQDLLLQGEQVASILSKLANKIRLIYQVKTLLKEGKTDQEMGKLLGMHPYPVKLAREASYNYSDKMLLEYLENLANVDLEMKQGNQAANLSFEIFMASI